jgi:lysophospholipase L1-like esterase
LVVDLGSPVNQVFILGVPDGPEQVSAEFQGAVFERAGANGLVWNTLAANGAQAKHFTQALNFSEQLAAMSPDLIIVSLGTNETQQSDYDLATAMAEQRRFWRLLRQVAPQASLLICSPPDASPSRRRPSERLDGFVQGLRRLTQDEGAAFLDLRAAQGGAGSYKRWRQGGYAGKDGVHYNGPGYRLMGQWALDALQGLEMPQ